MNSGDLKKDFPHLEVIHWSELFKTSKRNRKPCIEMLVGEYAMIEHCRKDKDSSFASKCDRIVVYDRAYVVNKLSTDLSFLLIGDLELAVELIKEVWEKKNAKQ